MIIDEEPAKTSKFSCCQKVIGNFKKKEVSKDIQMSSVKKKASKAIKIIVIGPGNSGKSTILKQMRIIHGTKYSESEKKKFKPIIVMNILDSVQRLVNAMKEISNLEFDNEANEEKIKSLNLARMVLDDDAEDLSDWENNIYDYERHIVSIWLDPSIKITYSQRNKFFLNDTAEYYFENLDRICLPDFVPQIEDILRVRKATTDILDYTFDIKGTTFQFLDVGGQRSERRKWVNCFENITSMLYITSLSDYDLDITEDELKLSNTSSSVKINRMKESIDLFHTIMKWKKKEFQPENAESKKPVKDSLLFEDVAIILFLNKIDLFADKFHQSSLKTCFPDYEDCSMDDSKNFVANKFLGNERKDNTYHHFTYALDTKHVEVVISVVKDTILQTLAKSMALF